MYHVDRGYADEQKRRTARPKWVILFKFIVFCNVFAFVFQAVFIGNLFFYLSSRWCLHNFPRLVNTCPSLRRRHCPRQRYSQRARSLIFPLEVVVHWFGTLFFTWCHCLSNCCVPAVRARPLLRVNSARECLTTTQSQPHPIPSVASRGCATSDER